MPPPFDAQLEYLKLHKEFREEIKLWYYAVKRTITGDLLSNERNCAWPSYSSDRNKVAKIP